MRSLCLFVLAAALAAAPFAAAGSYNFSTNTTTQYTGPGEDPVDFSSSIPGMALEGPIANTNLNALLSTPIDNLHFGRIPTTDLFGVLGEDGSLNVITISVPGSTFTDLEADIYGVYPRHDNVDFFLDTNEGEFSFSADLSDTDHNRNGHNYISIVALGGLVFNSITIGDLSKYEYEQHHPGSDVDTKFFAFNDLAISFPPPAPPPPPVPEPSTIFLLCGGLAGVLTQRRA